MLFTHHTEVRFASFLSDGFVTAIVVNPPERKLAKRTSVHRCRRQKVYLVYSKNLWQVQHYFSNLWIVPPQNLAGFPQICKIWQVPLI